jgi:DNA-binding CsgD family transcriptional regulator
VLEALHEVVPSTCNLFDWSDRAGNLLHYYFEGPIDHAVARHYFEYFYNRREAEAMPTFRQSLTGPVTVRSATELDRPEFFRSALYNEVWSPQGLHSRVEAIVRGARGQSLGSLVLYRGPSDAPFSNDEEERLSTVVPYLARAFEREPRLVVDYVPRLDRPALLSLSTDGDVLHISRDAHKLLLLAHGGITPDSVTRSPGRDAYPTLKVLVQQLRCAAQASATLTVENAWGRFVFEAQSLRPLESGGAPVVHVAVHHHESRAVSRRRVLAALPLSAAQREVCLLLCAGWKQGEIAKELKVAPSTVADHVKHIYQRLEVHSAHELRALVE